jgi:hypothetical protein
MNESTFQIFYRGPVDIVNSMYYWKHKKWDIKFLSFEKFDVSSQFIVILPLITVIEICEKIYFILLFSFFKCPLPLIKVDFDWDFALNKYSLRAYLHSFLQPTILIDNVNQFKVGLETDNGLKKTVTVFYYY